MMQPSKQLGRSFNPITFYGTHPKPLSAGCRPLPRPQLAAHPSAAHNSQHPKTSSVSAVPSPTTSSSDDLTEVAGRVLLHGNGIARRVLSDPGLEGSPLEFLKQTEAFWKAMKQQKHEPHKPGPTVITTSSSTSSSILAGGTPDPSTRSSNSSSRPPSFGAAPPPAAAPPSSSSQHSPSPASSSSPDFDVVMCGGTLGICVALALQQKGFRVAVVEKRRVEGRLQEWNTSRHELQVLVDLGLLTQPELEGAIVSEFNPIRVDFKGSPQPLTVDNVLNIGVCPKTLIAAMRAKFEVLGGVIYEHTAFKSCVVGADGVVVSLVNAAGAPAGVGDTNRPNAMQQQEAPQQLPSPFGRLPGSVAAAAAGHTSSSDAVLEGARHGSSGSNGGSSRFDRWVAAGSDSSQAPASSTQHVLQLEPQQQHHHHHQQHHRQQPQATPAATPAAGQAGRRRAPSKLTCRLLLDCMGHYSPIVKQLRGKAKPDGMVLVVGGCAEYLAGYPEGNSSADLLYSFTDAAADMQLFWEAFPAEGGKSRTTYMFAYSDADPKRPTFEKLLDTYFTLMPAYQQLPSLDAVKYKRVLFGGFPCYSSTTPLAPAFDRVLQLGDASASQSPLSFGGFGSMLRHLGRLSGAISHALQDDRLSRSDLAWIHPYQPSLSAAWLFQRSMSMQVGQLQQQQELTEVTGDAAAAPEGQRELPASMAAAAAASAPASSDSSSSQGSAATGPAPAAAAASKPPSWLHQLLLLPRGHINALLGANFSVMAFLGPRVLKPFLQDTLQLGPLAVTMFGMMLVRPLVIARVFVQVGPKVLLGWFGHFAMLAAYTAAYHVLRPLKQLSSSYTFRRLLDALQYGSSSDYHYSTAPPVRVDRHAAAAVERDGSSDAGSSSSNGDKPVVERRRREAVANNIVPGVPAAAVVQQQQQQQQPSAA